MDLNTYAGLNVEAFIQEGREVAPMHDHYFKTAKALRAGIAEVEADLDEAITKGWATTAALCVGTLEYMRARLITMTTAP